MGFLFEMLIEIVVELIIEGGLELAAKKDAPVVLRIIGALFYLLITGGILAVLILVTIAIMKHNAIFGWLFILFDVFLLGCVIYGIRKKLRS